MPLLALKKPEGFSLDAASQFFSGFVPGSGMSVAATDRLTLAFRLDHTFEAVATVLRDSGHTLSVEVFGTERIDLVEKQVARMLGLDAEEGAWMDLGRREPFVGNLQAEFPGFFTAAKASPYDAAAWGVISPRMQMKAAASLKMNIAASYGDAITVHDRTHYVFPSPTQILAMKEVPRLPTEKLLRLKSVATAALNGTLDADRLRSMSEHEAMTELQEIRGVGPWTAGHILHRGAAMHDTLPRTEPRVLHGFAAASGIENPTYEQFEHAAEAWKPFRMWVCILLARHLHRTGGWQKPGLTKERAIAGTKLKQRTTQQTAFTQIHEHKF